MNEVAGSALQIQSPKVTTQQGAGAVNEGQIQQATTAQRSIHGQSSWGKHL